MSLSMAIQFLIFILPLIYLPNIFNPYEFPKFLFFVAGVEILVLYFVWGRLKKNKLLDISKIDIGVILVLGFGLVSLVSDIFGIDPKVSLLGSNIRHQGFLTLLCGIILFLLVRFSFNNKSYSSFKKAILVSAFLLSLISLWQVLEINIFHNYNIPTYNGRIVGTLGNPNFLGGYLAILLPFVLFNGRKTFKQIIIKAVIVFAILATIFFTDSRSAFLAVGLLFLIYGLRFIFRLNISKIAKGLIVALVFLGFIKFADYTIHKNIVATQVPPIKERGCPESWPIEYPLKIISDIYNSKIFNSQREALCDNRLLIEVVGLEALSKRPILGYGQENFEIAVPAGKMHVADNAHNIFLEIAVSSGIIGLLLYIAIIFYFLKKTSKWDVRLSIMTFLIIAQFNPLSISQIALFWFLLGIASRGGKLSVVD